MTDSPRTITFYWRPGCGFCSRLERGLQALGLPFERRNIWEDAEAAADVRAVTGGNETVPTVVIGDAGMVNPSLDDVLTVVAAEAPDLLRSSRAG